MQTTRNPGWLAALAGTALLLGCGTSTAPGAGARAVATAGAPASTPAGAPASAPAVPAGETALPVGCGSQPGASTGDGRAALDPDLVQTSWVAGKTELVRGRLVYRDYLYDDYGAAGRTPSQPYSAAILSFSAGGQKYPAGQENTADLVALYIWVENGRLRVRGELNTLFDARSSVLAVALDTDNNPATGGGTWCGLKVASKGWDVLQLFPVGNPETNVVEGSLPLPAGVVWRVQAAVAQSDGTVMNVAFRGVDETSRNGPALGQPSGLQGSSFFDEKQAAALASGSIDAFGATVRVADLLAGRSLPVPDPASGFYERVYTSAYTVPRKATDTVGEGVAPAGVPGRGTGGTVPLLAQNFVFLGRYQPYAVYQPAGLKAPYPLQMVFHGSGAAMTSQVNQPGFQRAFGDASGRLLVSPLGRGPAGYGSDYGERDLLDVMADAQRLYPLDPEGTVASGYSQGGYITFRMAALYPDVFAGFVEWVGVLGNRLAGTPAAGTLTYNAGVVGDMSDFVGNLREIPGVMLHGGEDELAPLPATRYTQTLFAASDNLYEWYLHPAAEHLTFLALDDWGKEAAQARGWRRARNPARVHYRTDPALGNAALGIRHDRAYWLSAVTTRDPGAGEADLTARGCAATAAQSATGRHEGTDPVPWVSDYRQATGRDAVAPDGTLTGRLTNLASLNVDTAATCLAGGGFRYQLQTDGPAVVAFSDGRQLRLPAAGTYSGSL